MWNNKRGCNGYHPHNWRAPITVQIIISLRKSDKSINLPAWALETPTPDDRFRARRANRRGTLQIEWPASGKTRAWAKRHGWPAPPRTYPEIWGPAPTVRKDPGDGPHTILSSFQSFYDWAHGRYHVLEDGYDSWIGDDDS
jgi:hypothetical protein